MVTDANTAPAGLSPGAVVLQKYRVEKVLGQGGMGTVVAVRHTELGELFAMKVLLVDVLNRAGSTERFIREARSAARLKTDHVVRVYDVGKLETGAPYMLMEHLEGRDLADLLEERGRLSAREVVDFMLEALDAIEEAHAIQIVHRDLKPSNLFVSRRRDGSPALKVLDFGISKDLTTQNQASTHSASVMGSPYYMSPEHMRSAKHVDARTDIWSLGVIMFELLTGRLPFEGETPTEVCSAVLETNVPSIPALAPETPPELVDVILRCLQRAPADRYATAHDLQIALRKVSDELGEAPRSVLSSGSWLKARVSLPSVDPADLRVSTGRQRRVWSEDAATLAPPAEPVPASAPMAPPAEPEMSVSRPPSVQAWGTSSRPLKSRRPTWILIPAVATVCVGGWLVWSATHSSTKQADAAEHTAVAAAATAPTPTPSAEKAGAPSIIVEPAPIASATASSKPAASTHPAAGGPRGIPQAVGVPIKPPAAAPTGDADSGPALKRPKF